MLGSVPEKHQAESDGFKQRHTLQSWRRERWAILRAGGFAHGQRLECGHWSWRGRVWGIIHHHTHWKLPYSQEKLTGNPSFQQSFSYPLPHPLTMLAITGRWPEHLNTKINRKTSITNYLGKNTTKRGNKFDKQKNKHPRKYS